MSITTPQQMTDTQMTHSYTYEQIAPGVDPHEIDEDGPVENAQYWGSCMNDRTRAKYIELGVTIDGQGVTIRDDKALADALAFAERLRTALDGADDEAQSYIDGDDDVDYNGSYVMSLLGAVCEIRKG